MVDAEKHCAGGRERLAIGVVAPLSGRGAQLGLEMMQAAELAIEDGNAKYGPSGTFRTGSL
jgi:ABC-type branched-subunit amino acid transport system substrate-binding protein